MSGQQPFSFRMQRALSGMGNGDDLLLLMAILLALTAIAIHL